jgi:hypothetical protein
LARGHVRRIASPTFPRDRVAYKARITLLADEPILDKAGLAALAAIARVCLLRIKAIPIDEAKSRLHRELAGTIHATGGATGFTGGAGSCVCADIRIHDRVDVDVATCA